MQLPKSLQGSRTAAKSKMFGRLESCSTPLFTRKTPFTASTRSWTATCAYPISWAKTASIWSARCWIATLTRGSRSRRCCSIHGAWPWMVNEGYWGKEFKTFLRQDSVWVWMEGGTWAGKGHRTWVSEQAYLDHRWRYIAKVPGWESRNFGMMGRTLEMALDFTIVFYAHITRWDEHKTKTVLIPPKDSGAKEGAIYFSCMLWGLCFVFLFFLCVFLDGGLWRGLYMEESKASCRVYISAIYLYILYWR